MTSETRSLLVAAAVSPLAVIPATLPLAPFLSASSGPTFRQTATEAAAAFALVSVLATIIAYICMLAVGVPLAVVALRARRANAATALAAGLLPGLLLWAFSRSQDPTLDLTLALIPMYYGAVVSETFLLVLRRHRRWSEDRPTEQSGTML